jgi:signal transduction histidine kinase
MPATTLSRIFDPFFTTRLGQGGSGLGLAISRNIATGMLCGSLRAESEPGRGTSFTLSFPALAPL